MGWARGLSESRGAGHGRGGRHAEAAAETGLKEGTPVVIGGADTQLGLVGIGVADPGRFTVVGGSFWQHTLVLDRPLIDPQVRLRTLCHAVPGQWMIEGIGFYSGLAMRWFRDAFCDGEKERAAALGADAYALMEGRRPWGSARGQWRDRPVLEPDGRQTLGSRLAPASSSSTLTTPRVRGERSACGQSRRVPLTSPGATCTSWRS